MIEWNVNFSGGSRPRAPKVYAYVPDWFIFMHLKRARSLLNMGVVFHKVLTDFLWRSDLYLGPPLVYKDNQGAIALSKNAKGNPRTKHIDIKYDYVRDATEKGQVRLEYCPSEIMLADIFTKALPKIRFEELRTLIGVNYV